MPGPASSIQLGAAQEVRTTRPGLTPGSSLFRIWVVGLFGFFFTALLVMHSLIWGDGWPDGSWFGALLTILSLLWGLLLPTAVAGLVGMLLYRGSPMEADPQPIETPVSFRIVSRGQNSEALKATVDSIRREMAAAPLFPHRIEVITDLEVELDSGPDLIHTVVPKAYRTSNGALYKARAMHYAIETSDLPDHGWIVHLDEESHITASVIQGVRRAVKAEEASGQHRIGQGTILYHRHISQRWFLTLADSLRTGDDVGRFHLQYRTGFAFFGLHGSFIVVRNSVAREVGFDFEPLACVTEDAYWSVRQMALARRFRWVDGFVVEQCTQSLMDFLKQRRRWFVGLVKVAQRREIPMRYRFTLILALWIWATSWLGLVCAYVALFSGVYVYPPIRVAGTMAFALYVTMYVIGLKLNLEASKERISPLRRAGLYLGQVLLIPVFSAMESASVIYALVRPDVGFHVVKK